MPLNGYLPEADFSRVSLNPTLYEWSVIRPWGRPEADRSASATRHGKLPTLRGEGEILLYPRNVDVSSKTGAVCSSALI